MDPEMMYEVTVLSRGGQGGILGNKLLGKVAFLDGFKDIIAIPIIGAERRGAPIRAYLRISTTPIKRIDAVTNPDYILALDESILNYPAISSTIKDTTLIINSEHPENHVFPPSVTVYGVPATRIALDLHLLVAGQPVVNVAMLGAFARVSGLIKLETIKKVIIDEFRDKGEINYTAAKEAYEKTSKVN